MISKSPSILEPGEDGGEESGNGGGEDGGEDNGEEVDIDFEEFNSGSWK